ncbi:MAG: hypothetical protein QOH06_5956 [Acidobacteriota bacterium]|jgi:hypothetical protein|nr:hypothetical protein [Acidobacteriota bacterium]
MLKPACRQFRAELAPGDPHPRSCPACSAYAAAMERAAFKVPLPARLRSKLRAIPGATAPGPRLPLPQAPLPDPLRDRLRGLARRPAPRPVSHPIPAWVRTSRYAVAASYLMAVLVGLTAGNPVQLGRQAADRMSHVVSERLDVWEDTVRERVGETRRSLEDSLGSLDHQVDELSQSLRSLEPLITRRIR